MDLDKYVGDKFVTLECESPCSPCVKMILGPNADVEQLVELYNESIMRAWKRFFGSRAKECDFPLSNGPPRMSVRIHEVIAPREDRDAKRAKLMSDLGEWFAQSADARDKAHAENPNNGTLGYWLCNGIRHQSIVRASSATEAVEKCGLDSWEQAGAVWIGEEMPEVYEI